MGVHVYCTLIGDLKETLTVRLNFPILEFFLKITFKGGIAVAFDYIP